MPTRQIRCASALHNTRSGLNDGLSYSDDLGTYNGVIPPPLKCERCGVADAGLDRTAETTDRVRRLNALQAFRTATGLTNAQIMALFDARERGDV